MNKATSFRSANRFQKGSGVYVCRICKHNTRDTGGDGSGVQLCDICFELAGEENHLSDHDGEFYGTPVEILNMIAAIEKRGGDTTPWAALKAAALAKYNPDGMQPTIAPVSGILYSILDLADDKWLANVRAEHPGAAIRDYMTWPAAKQSVYAVIANT